MINRESSLDLRAIARELMTIEYTLYTQDAFDSMKTRALILQAKMLLDDAANTINGGEI